MATYYMDMNGATAGFGTLSQTAPNANIPASTNALGTSATSSITFSAATAHILNFGSASTSNGTPGTLSTNLNGVQFGFNGLVFQNLTGTQLITTAGATTGTLTLVGTNPFIEVTANGVLDINRSMVGTVNWEKRGATILRLRGNNTFSGGMRISAGTVEIGSATALGNAAGIVTMTGGKLSSSSTTAYTVANALTLNGTMTLGDTTNNGALAFTGALTLTGASTLTTSSGVTFNAAGTSAAAYNLSATASAGLYFTGGAGTFSGGTASFLGTSSVFLANFNIGTPNQLVGFSTIALSGGSNIQLCGDTTHTFANAFTGTASVVIYNRNTSLAGLIFNGTMSGYLGSLRIYADSVEGANPVQKTTLTNAAQFAFANFWFQSGGGLTTLSQTLSYTGTSVVSHNKPFVINASALTSGGTAIYSNDSTNGSSITNTGTFAFETAGTYTLRLAAITGPISLTNTVSDSSGTLNLSKIGNNTVTLSGANTFKGPVSVTAGTLNANSTTALGANNAVNVSVSNGACLSLGAQANYNVGKTLALAGVGPSDGSGGNIGGLIIANAGTSNTFSGGITLGGPTYIRATESGTLLSNIAGSGNAFRLGAAASKTFTYSGIVSDTSSFLFGRSSFDTGTVVVSGNNTTSGAAAIDWGTLRISADANLGTAPGVATASRLTIGNNTTLATTATFTLNSNRGIALGPSTGSGTGTIDVASATTLTYAGIIANNSAGVGALAKAGEGSLTLSSASSTFSGGVTITSGTLFAGAAQSGASGPLGITGTITFGAVGTGTLAYTSASASFDYSSRFATSNGQSRRINVNGESVTFSTAMGGTNAFALVGTAGTLTLAVANTYTQGTTLSVGTLKCGNSDALGSGAVTMSAGTTLQSLTAGGQNGKLTITGTLTNSAGGTIRIGG